MIAKTHNREGGTKGGFGTTYPADEEALRFYTAAGREAFTRTQRPWSPRQLLDIMTSANIPVWMAPAILAYEDAMAAVDAGRGRFHTRCEVLQRSLTVAMLPRPGENIHSWCRRIDYNLRELEYLDKLPPRRTGTARRRGRR